MERSALICWLLFGVTYCGIAAGGLPGLAIDRTGIALLGAIAMVTTGVLPLPEAMAALDAPTLLLLFGLMLVSAQLSLSGFYTRIAWSLGRLAAYPQRFLLFLMITSGALSAVLVNDIVCLAFTPVVVAVTSRAGLRPVPYLLGLACASNIGSGMTLIGNPQNMLIGQLARLDFGGFLVWCALPVLVSLAMAYGLLLWLYRNRLRACPAPRALDSPPPQPAAGVPHNPGANGTWQMRKGLWVAGGVILLFFTGIPREITALTAGGLLLCSRSMDTRRLLGRIDWSLILLFCGLFVVIAGLESTGLPALLLNGMARHGLSLTDPVTATVVGSVLSNLVSNVPAVMLLIRFMQDATAELWYVLALASTFAGNFITIGSIANLIVIEQARTLGVVITFREHARTGVPVTGMSLLTVMAWGWLLHLR